MIKMLENIDCVIFDFDGTLADSMWMWTAIDVEYLGRFGKELPSLLQDEISGMSFVETAHYIKRRMDIPDTEEQMMADWNSMAEEKYANDIKAKEGVIPFLKYLKAHDIKTGVATSNSRHLADIGIKAIGIADYIDYSLVGCEVEHGKPAPDIYLAVADRLNVHYSRCLVFEDVTKGILAGKNAGMKTCGVYDKFSEYEAEAKRELSDYYIHSFAELL